MRTSTVPTVLAALLACALVLLVADRSAPDANAAPAPAPSAAPTPISSLPFVAATAGTYCVTADLTATTRDDGILITTNNVVIDLGGFAIVGGSGATHGILQTAGRRAVVRNGEVRGWLEEGVELLDHAVVENVLVRSCAGRGIEVRFDGRVRSCDVEECLGGGIATNVRSTVSDCRVESGDSSATGVFVGGRSLCVDTMVSGGTGAGIALEFGSRIERSSVAGAGPFGIRLDSFCTAIDCFANGCDGDGIVATGASVTVERCTSAVNLGAGFATNAQNTVVRENLSTNNGTGFDIAGTHNLVVGNSAIDNTIADFAIAPLNPHGPILRDFGVIQSQRPQANFATPLL